MFETICIRQNDKTFASDIGFVAENLLYYKEVVLIAGQNTLPVLLNNCDIGILKELLASKSLRLCVCENVLGVATQQRPDGQTLYGVTSISSESLKAEENLYTNLYKATGRRGHSKRIIAQIMPFVERIKYDGALCDSVRDDLAEESYTKAVIADIINYYGPNINIAPNQIQYRYELAGQLPFGGPGFLFNTNLDLEQINKQIPNNPDGKLINTSGLMLNILETRGDMHLASSLKAEIATSEIHTALMRLKFKDIYEKTTKHKDDLYQFNDFILSNGHAIRETINNGGKEFKDFMEILNKADKFKSWLSNIGEDKSIIKEYYEAVTKETWVDKLPSKAVRWSFFTGAGLALDLALTGGLGTAIGVGISLGDEFLLDKVVNKWKPNIFVERKLKPFVEKNSGA